MEGVKSQSLDAMAKSMAELGSKHGTEAASLFVKDWNLGSNASIDALFREGIESNASIIVQRLPWARVIPSIAEHTRELLLQSSGVDQESIDREVVDELIWTYIASYDKASRKYILDTVTHERDDNART